MHPRLRTQEEIPRPYVLLPTLMIPRPRSNVKGRKTEINDAFRSYQLADGDEIVFAIALVGTHIRYWRQVVASTVLFAADGFGPGHVPFDVKAIEGHDHRGKQIAVFGKGERANRNRGVSGGALRLFVGSRLGPERPTNRIRVRFLSSACIRVNGSLRTELSFKDFFSSVSNRLEYLSSLYCDPPNWIDYRPLQDKCEAIRIQDNCLEKFRVPLKNSDGSESCRDGLMGQIVYEGEGLGEFLPILAAGEIINAGSNTSHGMGRFEIDIA